MIGDYENDRDEALLFIVHATAAKTFIHFHWIGIVMGGMTNGVVTVACAVAFGGDVKVVLLRAIDGCVTAHCGHSETLTVSYSSSDAIGYCIISNIKKNYNQPANGPFCAYLNTCYASMAWPNTPYSTAPFLELLPLTVAANHIRRAAHCRGKSQRRFRLILLLIMDHMKRNQRQLQGTILGTNERATKSQKATLDWREHPLRCRGAAGVKAKRPIFPPTMPPLVSRMLPVIARCPMSDSKSSIMPMLLNSSSIKVTWIWAFRTVHYCSFGLCRQRNQCPTKNW